MQFLRMLVPLTFRIHTKIRCLASKLNVFKLVPYVFRLTLSNLGHFLSPLVLRRHLLVQRGLESSQQVDSRSFLSELSLISPLMLAFHCDCATVTVPMECNFNVFKPCKQRVEEFYIVAYFQTVSI